MNITGKTLIDWGFEPGPWFKDAIAQANAMRSRGVDDEGIFQFIADKKPEPIQEIPLRTNSLPIGDFLLDDGFTEDERTNYEGVIRHMDALMRVPTIVKGAIMPDACPSGSAEGTIPVGGVVATKDAIHPGFHSADICCSMAISVFKRDADVSKILDAAMRITHFGAGGRTDIRTGDHNRLMSLISSFENNPFLKGLESYAERHFMTQGDGNHFLFVGEVASSGRMAIVTHHGSRGLGGQIYKRGKAAAERHTKIVAPRIPLHQAWIPADTQTGDDYWAALQVARQWTKLNHLAIHDAIGRALGIKIEEQWWNEHNFVFRKSDGLFYHAKGATPTYHGYADDSVGSMLIPLNMSEPILIVEPAKSGNQEQSMGFSPHGAGRLLSRTAHTKRLMQEFGAEGDFAEHDLAEIIRRETSEIDVRFFTGSPDVSELPSAYKNADQVVEAIHRHELADIVDTVLPRGSIMAGEMNWNRRR